MTQLRRKPGFTLLEITVVVTIIATFAFITLGYFRNVRRDATFQQCEANLNTLAQAMERYKANNEFYATTLSEILSDAYGLRSIPRCPGCPSATSPTQTYDLQVPATGQQGYQYVIYCVGNYHKGKTSSGYPQYSSIAAKLYDGP